ncbi:hypothetical protein KM800_04295 [Clostridium tyrobutyricum]|uniref:hypothetical protein n=1 Tax=Clostridium tyrobutyricum TaxID=1519 RepID=UPI001C387BD7|nr:hypothetical protein [Clostridium tyrobutyricum]MBV4418547.1 hypothetical protein [Clostridium tyrobutyricum]
MNKYHNYYYWEHALENRDVFRLNNFEKSVSIEKSMFVNTAIIDYDCKLLDNDWSCYMDTKAALGFFQYVYIPMAFFHVINKGRTPVSVPVCSTDEYIKYIDKSSSEYRKIMKSQIVEIESFWKLENDSCIVHLSDFCKRFNSFWNRENVILNMSIYGNALEIAENLMDGQEFQEVVEEDIGITRDQLFDVCMRFYREKIIQRTFIEFLNNRVGCII